MLGDHVTGNITMLQVMSGSLDVDMCCYTTNYKKKNKDAFV